jgi:hypothetical protein
VVLPALEHICWLALPNPTADAAEPPDAVGVVLLLTLAVLPHPADASAMPRIPAAAALNFILISPSRDRTAPFVPYLGLKARNAHPTARKLKVNAP